MKITINFDLDGTLVDLYGVEGWLSYLENKDTTPYEIAKPCIDLAQFARLINKLQHRGFSLGVISWLSKTSDDDYDERVTEAKKEWLNKHLPSVHWDKIYIIPYGTPKENYSNGFDILYDDEEKNRTNWIGCAKDETEIIDTLKALL